MRLDKFLKISRIIKRRTVAQEACDGGRVLVNGTPAKSGKQVDIGDEITVLFGSRPLTVRITRISETVKKEDAASLYEIILQ